MAARFEGNAVPLDTGPSAPIAGKAAAAIVLLLLCLLYWLTAIHPGSHAYLDYVDGYYLYVAQRMDHGAVLYSGVMGVQPPGIYLVGAALFRLHDQLATARVYSGLLHCGTIVLVAAVTFRLTGRGVDALVSAVIYTLAPYGLIWSRIFDPNPLVTFLSLCCLWALLGDRGRWAALAGGFAALALLTKVWYVPVGCVAIWWLATHRRQQLVIFMVGALVPAALACALGTLSAGAAFWRGLLVQDASPVSGIWFESSFIHVLIDDWLLVILGLAGARALWRSGDHRRRLAALWISFSCLVLLATVKEGTAWPVFQFAEPFLAVGATALLLGRFGKSGTTAVTPPTKPYPIRSAVIAMAILLLLAVPALRTASSWPNSGEDVLIAALRSASPTKSPVLAPPYYLYLSGRLGVDRFADINLWGQQAIRGDAQAVRALSALVAALNRRSVPMILADNRVRALEGVPQALQAHYRQLPLHDSLPADRSVTVWVPR
jgi:4-amino-4-deoxy-L-arabinose transferase-like glycosyltransferase